MISKFTTNRSFHGLFDQSGQSVVEYILLMVVAVAVIAGVLMQFNRAFETFANNLFGDYLECLLETGELPSLGSVDESESVCAEFYSPLQASGAEMAQSDGVEGGGSGSAGGSNGGRGGDGSRGSDGRSGSGDRTSQGRVSEGGGSGAGGRGRGRNRFGRVGGYRDSNRRNNSRGGADGGGVEDGVNTGSTGISSNNFGSNRNGAPKRFKERRLGGGFGYGPQEEEEREKRIPTKTKKVKSAKKDRPQVFKVERTPAKKENIDADEGGFGFGYILKWLIIAGIIIAIVLFFGGQALQISKSMD